MKTTSAVTLLLMGASVAACDSEQRHRAFYENKDACLKDWGTEDSCQPSRGPNGAFVYFGPWYNSSSPFWGGPAGHLPALSRRAAVWSRQPPKRLISAASARPRARTAVRASEA